MTPFQNLLIAITLAVFFAFFGRALIKEGNQKAGNFFQVIAGFTIFALPFIIIWCILYYINW